MLETIAGLENIPKISKFDVLYGHIITADPVELLEAQRLQQLYGNIYSCHNLFAPNIYTACGAEEIAHIHKNHKNYVKRYKVNKVFGQTIGQGILNCSGPKYEDRRKNMLPVFKMSNLKQYFITMQESIDIFIDRIRQDISAQQKNNLEQLDNQQAVIDIDHYATLICLDIAAKTFFNRDWGDDLELVSRIVDDLNKACRTSGTLKKHVQVNNILSYLKKIIKKRFIDHKELDINSDMNSGLLYYLQDYKGNPEYRYKSEAELLDEVTTLLITGHETSATAVVFAMALLQIDNNYKNLVISEIDNLNINNKNQIEYNDLQQCIYTRMWIDETMRMYPPVWFTLRYCLEEDNINGFYMPAKSYIFSNFYVLHRNPEYWPQPNVFNPFRFALENKHNLVPYSYLPFIMGPRTCLAANFASLEIQLIVTKLLQHFDFNVIPGTSIKLSPHITLRTEDGLELFARNK